MSTPPSEPFPIGPAPQHPEFTNPRAGARPIVAKYTRGHLSEDELLAALLDYPWSPAPPNSAPVFSLEWLTTESVTGTDPSRPYDLGLWVYKGLVPVAVADAVSRALGVTLSTNRGPAADRNAAEIAARRAECVAAHGTPS